ncbi:hypothetical protein AOLI_G00167280 [Acnodon oligacanthus]
MNSVRLQRAGLLKRAMALSGHLYSIIRKSLLLILYANERAPIGRLTRLGLPVLALRCLQQSRRERCSSDAAGEKPRRSPRSSQRSDQPQPRGRDGQRKRALLGSLCTPSNGRAQLYSCLVLLVEKMTCEDYIPSFMATRAQNQLARCRHSKHP